MGKSKPADLNKSLPTKSNKKAKDTIPTEESVEPEVPVTKNKTKQESNINPASKKIQKEAVVPQKPNKEKQVAKQEAKKENKAQAAKEAKEVKKVEEETKEEVEQESNGLDVKNFAQIAQAQTEKYNRIRRKIMADVPFDKDQIKEAAKALITYHNASKKPNQLLDTNDDFLYVEIILSEVPDKHSIRPVQVKLPVPIYGPEYQSRFCVFSRDPQRAYKDKIQDLEIPTIAKVIGYKKLVKKYPQYEDKRKLFHDYDLFFCDYKLYNLLREHTGKIFYEGKKIPFPIDCTDVPEHLKEEYKTYQEYLNSLAQCSYFSMGNGPVYTAKVARVSMNLKDIVKNIIHGIYNTIPYIIKENIQHTKVRQISIKTASSISLPIFNQLTEDELKAIAEVEKPVVSKKDKKAAKKEAAAPVNGNATPKQAQKPTEKAAAPQKQQAAAPQKQAQKPVEKAAAPQKQAQKPAEKAAAPQKQQAAPQKAAPQKAAPQKGSKKGGKMQVEE